MQSMHRILLWTASLLGLYITSPAVGLLNEEDTSFVARNYSIYFVERFGETDDRPPADVLEQRCIHDIRQSTAVAAYAAYHPHHVLEVAKVWSTCATPKSLPALESAFRVCQEIIANRVVPKPRGHGADVPWNHLWEELSTIWLHVQTGSTNEDEFNQALIDALTTQGVQLHPELLADQIIASGRGLRDILYRELLDKDAAFRSDVGLYRILSFGYWEPDHPNAWAFRPTNEQLVLMLQSDAPEVAMAAKWFVARVAPAHREGKEAIIADLRSNEYYRIEASTGLMASLIKSTMITLEDKETAAELLGLLDQRFRDLQDMHNRGETVEIDRTRLRLDQREGFEQLRIPLIVKSFLDHIVRSHGGRHDPIVTLDGGASLRNHVQWLTKVSGNLPEDMFYRDVFDHTIEYWRNSFKEGLQLDR